MSIKESELLNKMIGCLVDQIAHSWNELDVYTEEVIFSSKYFS